MSELFGDLFDLPPEENEAEYVPAAQPQEAQSREYFSHMDNPKKGKTPGAPKPKTKQKKEKKSRKKARKKNRRR
jgi:hypothetical protein